MGRRWTTEEKVIALAVLKKSPRCYNLLRRYHFILVSMNTYFNTLPSASAKMKIGFCEMDIKEHLQYDCQADRIIGFEELDGSGEI
ncbi:hypothetical protein NQ317_000792 [Molorchus minor]|uniref:Transposase n=1 Tax=Molorchus minor TaxID=1323400 RepID=A0ABQ9J4Q1_9CUCU|nr:hypothetical protein NQ317_000792 [Molorchus minor]